MPEGLEGMIEEHTWARKAHHAANTFTHLWLVAMHSAALTGGLSLTKLTSVETQVGISQQLLTFTTKRTVTLLMTAIESYHEGNSTLFALYP